METSNERIAEQKFEQFLSMSFACKDNEESRSCIQFLLDQLTLFLGAQKSYIVTQKSRFKILFESNGLSQKNDEYCTIPICENAIHKALIQKSGVIFENHSNEGINEHKNILSDYVVLCVPILIDHVIHTWLQLIKVKEYEHFYDHDIEFVIKVANILAPLLRKDVKDTEISNLSETALLEKSLRQKYDFSNVIGHNNKMIELLDLVTKVMDVDVPVLIEGESGTGKELIARAVHHNSKRKKHLMVSVNCGAIPENLLESEFFGHEKGAFTGATSKKIGHFEVANNGTIFLDEIGALNLTLQVKLLRVLQWNEFTPVGGILPKKVDVRIIAASNQKLSELVEQKKFREDLYYRLNVLRLCLPPLRERKDDIPALCKYLIEQNCAKMGKIKMKISADAMDILMNYDFPGNVRELENIIQRAIIFCDGNEINYAHLPFEVKMNGKKAQKINGKNETFKTAKQRVIEAFEKQYITNKLMENRGIILRAAKKSGMYEANFRAKMKQYDIVVDDIFPHTDLNG